jgi:hypothetical protein
MFLCFGNIINGLYVITLALQVVNNFILELSSSSLSLKRKITFTHEAYFWHLHLGRINPSRSKD